MNSGIISFRRFGSRIRFARIMAIAEDNSMKNNRLTAQKIIELVRAAPATRVKVAVTDIDGVLRGKYLHKDKFLAAADSGFGFCNVVFGWDSSDACYDNTT